MVSFGHPVRHQDAKEKPLHYYSPGKSINDDTIIYTSNTFQTIWTENYWKINITTLVKNLELLESKHKKHMKKKRHKK